MQRWIFDAGVPVFILCLAADRFNKIRLQGYRPESHYQRNSYIALSSLG
jgi:hypothetical protein